ncbi:four helix bundle protein [Fibrella sp. USSR17]
MKISHFDDIIAWQKDQDLAALIYETFQHSRDFSFCQAAVSNNIAEGFERSSNADFARFRFIAKKGQMQI